MRHDVDEELAGWFKARNMEVPTSIEIPEDSREAFEKHLTQAKQFRHLGDRSRLNWAVWTHLTHVGFDEARHPLAGTTEPLKAVDKLRSVESSVPQSPDATALVEAPTEHLTLPAPEPTTVEHYTIQHVGLGARGWLALTCLVIFGETVLHLVSVLVNHAH